MKLQAKRKLCWELDSVVSYSHRPTENRLYKTQLALCEIAFAKGYNATTSLPLPHWKYYRSQHLNKCRSEQDAFTAGITFAQEWEISSDELVTDGNRLG